MDRKQTLTKELSKLHQQEVELQLSYAKRIQQIQTSRESILSELLPGYCKKNKGGKPAKKILNNSCSAQPNLTPCDNCDKTETCKEPCELLEALLPCKYGGSYILSNTFGNLMDKISDTDSSNIADDGEIHQNLDSSTLISIDKDRTKEVFMLYKNCLIIFTKNEWRVVTLRVKEGLTYKEIGLKLGIKTSTASDTFRRAKWKMENYYSKKRNS